MVLLDGRRNLLWQDEVYAQVEWARLQLEGK
jgi:hypothetical protein